MPLTLLLLLAFALLGAAMYSATPAEAAIDPGQGAQPLPADSLPADPVLPQPAPLLSTWSLPQDFFAPAAPAFLPQLVDTSAAWSPPAAAAPYLAAIASAEDANGIPRDLLARTLYEESRFRADIIDGRTASSVGAQGIAQFMPATAAQYGIDPLDPFQAIPAAALELSKQYKHFGAWGKALAAYNWGAGNLGRKGVGAEPAETRRYVAAILGDLGLST